MKLTLSSNNNALYPLLHFVLDDLPTRSKSPTLSWYTHNPCCPLGGTVLTCILRDNLKQALEGTGVAPLAVQDLMGTYLAYLVSTGRL